MPKYLIILCLFLTSCSSWSQEAKVTYGLMWATQSVDYYQTKQIIDDDNFREMNDLANDLRVIEYILITNAAIIIVAQFLPDSWRQILFAGKAGINTANVWHNYSEGVR